MSPSRISLFVIVLALAAVAGAWVAGQTLHSAAPAELTAGTRISPAREIDPFSLVTHLDQPFERQALVGHWTLMFFGFTHCPGVCPATLATLVEVRRRLEPLEAGALPQIVLVSVDPERDTPRTLAGYVARFDAPVIGVTGSTAAIDAFASRMGVAHHKIAVSDGDYMVDHSAFVLLLDPQARVAAVFTPPHSAERLATDYLRMLDRG